MIEFKGTVVYFGGGYCGLTGAVHFAKAGFKVIIVDINLAVVKAINAGQCLGHDFLQYVDKELSEFIASEQIQCVQYFDYYSYPDVSAYIITVPSEQEGIPNVSIVELVFKNICYHTSAESLICIESTLIPGTIDDFLKLQEYRGQKVVVAPRRDWFADPAKNLGNLDRVVGGINTESAVAGLKLYQDVTVIDKIHITHYETAELVKVVENSLLHVQIMLAQELSFAYPNLDVREAFALAGTHWRLSNIYPGFGSGGRCIYTAPYYLLKGMSPNKVTNRLLTTMIELDMFSRNAILNNVLSFNVDTILVLGIGYRPGFKDAGSSPGLYIAQQLCLKNKKVIVVDPYFSQEEIEALIPGAIVGTPEIECDLVILATPHKTFVDLPRNPKFITNKDMIIDAQGTWLCYKQLFENNNIDYRAVGTPNWLG